MKIISTNISKIKTVEHNGKKVKTGIFKTPTNEPVVIEKLNIIGDEQADLVNHGGVDKAVYAFSHNHYDYLDRLTLEKIYQKQADQTPKILFL